MPLIWPNILVNIEVIQHLVRFVSKHSNLLLTLLSPLFTYRISRTSFQSSKTTSFHDCWIMSMMVTNRSLQVKSETPSILWIISMESYDQDVFKSTTQHMTSVANKIHFIQVAVHLSWCSHENMVITPILSGMHKYSAPFSLQLIIMVSIKQWRSCGWDGLGSCLAINGVLKRLAFRKLDSSDAFGFLDPSLVLHACHLIPAFAKGRTDSLLPCGPSVARENGDLDDWTAYYVNM